MSILPREELEILIKGHEGECVSIYMPTHKAGIATQQDPIRLKNLLRDAEDCLQARGLRTPEINNFFEPANRILLESDFWQRRNEGLAVFISANRFYYYRLPLRFEELVVVTDRFHVKPLLPLLSGDGGFYILALSQKNVRLLRGARDSVSEVETEGIPGSLAEALRFTVNERQPQLAAGTSGSVRKRSGVFHGHGVGDEDSKTRILEYFRLIDRGFAEFASEDHDPLVLAGVDYLFPIYREASSYPNLLEGGIEGNPETLSAEELHSRAWELVEPGFNKVRDEDHTRYMELKGSGRTSKNVREVVRAAFHGRVDILFVALNVQYWGMLLPETDTVHLHKEPGQGDDDLLDFAAIHTYLNGGRVYAVEQEGVPGQGPVAAVFRY